MSVAGILAACHHPRLVPKGETKPAVVAPRDVEVRALSRPVGSAVIVAEVDHHHVAVVADEEESALVVVDLDTRTILSNTRLESAPAQLVLDAGGTLFVAQRGAARIGAFRFREGAALQEVAHHETGEEPFGLALTPDKMTLLVSTIAGARLEAYRTKDLEAVFVAPLPRDPRGIAITTDGKRAFVSHATGSVLSVIDLDSAGPTTRTARSVSLEARERRRDFGMEHRTKKPMPPSLEKRSGKTPAPDRVQVTMKRAATQGFALAMVGDNLFLPEALVMTGNPQAIPTGYGSVEASTLGTHIPFIARARLADEKVENLELSGPADRTCFEAQPECILPRAMADDGKNLYIACLDSDELLVVDPSADAEHASSCAKTLEARGRVKIESPTDVSIDADRKAAVVFSTFSRRLSVVPLARTDEVAAIELPRRAPLGELVADGRRLFHRSADPRISKNGRACASCHVDGRDDALIWPTPLGKRQTPMLAGRIAETAPYGWNGEHPSLVAHIKSTVKNLDGAGLSDPELDALAAYVTTMKAPSKRHGTHAAAAVRGKTVFASNEAGCSSCHTEATHFTDLETHALGKSGGPAFDTPSLAFVGQTAPYFHDGRFKTLEELVDGCDGVMGQTKHLSADSRQDLVAYLRTL